MLLTKAEDAVYSKINQIDSKALKSLLAYNPLFGGDYAPEGRGGLSEEDFQHAVSKGMLFALNVEHVGHDEIQPRLLKLVKSADKPRTVALFLSSFSTKRLDYRAGLPAFALTRTFSAHKFVPVRPDSPFCSVCGLQNAENAVDRNRINRQRFAAGAVVGAAHPGSLAFHLECLEELQAVEPSTADLAIFGNILEILATAEPTETAKKKVLQRIRKVDGFKGTPEQTQFLLEALGYCGILESPEHGGMLHRYVNLGTAPSKTHSSDWSYPVDFWLGEHGLNKEAVRSWFGDYKELESYWK